jgi:hypothetical protein
MAKKHTKKFTRSTTTLQAAKPVAPISVQEIKATRVPRRSIEDTEFSPDYTPIISDLKRIGVLAGSFFVILVVLSFIL